MRRKASLELKSKAFDLYKNGKSAKEVASIIGYSESTIRRWLKDEGIPIRNGGYYNIKHSKELIYNIINLYNEGRYANEIDSLLGLKRGTAAYVLNKNNISMRHRGPKSKIELEDFFDNIDTEEKAYFLGFILADGNISIYNNQYSLKIHISLVDKEIIDKFLVCIKSTNKTSIKISGKNKSYYVSLTSVHMCKRLIELGIVPNKTGRETFPKCIPENLVRHFIRGIFDGDGITDVYNNRSGFVGSESLLLEIKKILGIDFKLFKAGKNKKVVYFLGGKKFSKKLYDYMYKDAKIFLTRKKDRMKRIILNDGTPYA